MAWTDVNSMIRESMKYDFITLEKLQAEIGDKKEISLRIEGVIPAQIPYKLSQRVKRLMLYKVSKTDKHSISSW